MIKSQDDLNEQSRQSDVLIEAINNAKCWYDVAREKVKEVDKLKKQLKIAVDILEIISTHTIIPDEDTVEQVGMIYNWSSEALNQIEELNK